jgi:hypothetical protein
MTIVDTALKAREREGRPVRVALIGDSAQSSTTQLSKSRQHPERSRSTARCGGRGVCQIY